MVKDGEYAELKKIIDHPATFIIPYSHIVEAEFQKVGSLFKGKRKYLIVTTEREEGKFETYYIHPCESTFADMVVALRFNFERQTYIFDVIGEAIGLDSIQADLLKTYQEKYGDKLKKYAKEFHEIADEQKELAVSVESTRDKMKNAEKRFGVKFPPLIRKMYRM